MIMAWNFVQNFSLEDLNKSIVLFALSLDIKYSRPSLSLINFSGTSYGV